MQYWTILEKIRRYGIVIKYLDITVLSLLQILVVFCTLQLFLYLNTSTYTLKLMFSSQARSNPQV